MHRQSRLIYLVATILLFFTLGSRAADAAAQDQTGRGGAAEHLSRRCVETFELTACDSATTSEKAIALLATSLWWDILTGKQKF
jgi:hypothetical protein